jgi:hypothetical protein
MTDDDDDLDALETQAASMSPKSKMLFAAVIVGIISIVAVPAGIRVWREEAVAAKGVEASATVKKLEQTGNLHNDVEELRITLEVEPADAGAYEAEVRKYVSPIHVGKIQPGAAVTVKYDPKHPERVAIIEPKLE